MPLVELGIGETRVRRVVTGGLIIEIPGEGNGEKADALAARLHQTFEENLNVRVARPVRSSELSIADFDDTVSPQEIAARVAAEGNVTREK